MGSKYVVINKRAEESPDVAVFEGPDARKQALDYYASLAQLPARDYVYMAQIQAECRKNYSDDE